ncbi:hypothetical protein [Vibrio rotiferianus]|uniref:hypothetical protein n=1 Tax=Vibrio rotiferianus TaxID=190895 RepID=UPI0015F498B3|nr:hypothetical protein [Vibrio rotiferianus]
MIDDSAFRRTAFDATSALALPCDKVWLMEETTILYFRHSVAMKLGKLGKTTDKSREWWMRPNKGDEATKSESG